ncbi:MAG: ATP-binding protein [bacterium]|nr:ATP-binding protein [bacterium]
MCRILLVLLTCLAVLLPSALYANPVANGELRISGDLLDQPDKILPLAGTWKYHPGDNPAWADPAFDDTSWDLVDPKLPPGAPPPGNWNGIGWFRLHVQTDEQLPDTRLGLGFHMAGNAEIYLDGRRIYSSGPIDASGKSEKTHSEHIFPINLRANARHVIAVRFSNFHVQEFFNRYHLAGFEMALGQYDGFADIIRSSILSEAGNQMFFTGMLLAFALLHLLLFFFYPRSKENLYYAGFTGSFAGLVFILNRVALSTGKTEVLSLLYLFGLILLTLNLMGVRFIYSLFYKHLPRQFWGFLAIGLVLAVGSSWISLLYVYLFTFLIFAEMLRTIFLAVHQKKEGAWIIAIGFTLFIVATTCTLLMVLGILGLPHIFYHTYLFGSLGLMISFSIYLARNFAQTSRNLEGANRQLEDYSQTLEQKVAVRTKELNEKNTTLETTLQQLRETQDQLIMQEKMASLGSLVAGVAHEINNPIGAVKSASDVSRRCIERIQSILSSDRPTQNIREDAQFLKALDLLQANNRITVTGSDRIATIVRSLRNFARLDEAQFQEANLHEGLDSTLTLIEHELKNRITVIRTYGDLPLVPCYPNELNQVFMNLLLNAAHAIESQGEIHIETSASLKTAILKISDTGKGIPPKNLSRIFDPGFTTKGVGVGTGLGLSISYNIVQKHRGELHVESQVGKGTTFTITLPTDLKEPPTNS